MMANLVYNRFSYNLAKKLIDLSEDTIKCALLTDAYTPDADHNEWTDISEHQVSGLGYTAGGKTLTGQTVTQDDENDRGVFDADDVEWTTMNVTSMYAVLYDISASSNLICLIDFGGNKDSGGADFTIVWHADGIINLSLMVVC